MIQLIVFAAALLIVVAVLFTTPPSWLLDAISRNWPTTPGTIEGGKFYVVGAQQKIFRAKLRYTYTVEGRLWAGADTQDFYDEETASDCVESRKGMAAQVKYNPRNPKRSVLM